MPRVQTVIAIWYQRYLIQVPLYRIMILYHGRQAAISRMISSTSIRRGLSHLTQASLIHPKVCLIPQRSRSQDRSTERAGY